MVILSLFDLSVKSMFYDGSCFWRHSVLVVFSSLQG